MSDIIEKCLEEFDDLKGISNEVLTCFESELGFTLPQAYQTFLLIAGEDDGNLFYGAYASLNDYNYNKELAKTLLSQSNTVIQNYFPFCSYNADQFLFFNPGDNTDPAVFRFELELVGNEPVSNLPSGVVKVADKFSFLITQLAKEKRKYS